MNHRGRRIAAFAIAAVLVIGAGGSLAIHRVGLDRLPDVHRLATSGLESDTLVYDRTGTVLLADLHPPGYQHYETDLKNLGKWLPKATEALAGRSLTPRLVRLRLGLGGGSVSGRVRQAVIAAEASIAYSSSQRMEMYLNSAFYGNGAYGAEAAARVYFQTEASKLDLAQAALLAGIPDRPALLDPIRSLPAAKRQQRQVLDAMVRNGMITSRQADDAYRETVQVPGPSESAFGAPHFVLEVIRSYEARYGQGSATKGGHRIVTTLDWDLQQLAERAVADAVAASAWRHGATGALVAMDPRTGAILAMVGSADFRAPGGQYNMAVTPLNPGSLFRVFTYAAAIESARYTMVTSVADRPITIEVRAGMPTWQPQNFDRRFHGICELQACLGNALDVPAVEVQFGVGIPEVVRVARALGSPPLSAGASPSGAITYTIDDPAGGFAPVLTLGGYGQTVLQMTAGMSSLAAEGMSRRPVAMRSVSTPRGTQAWAASAKPQQVISPGAAFITSQMLADDTNRAMTFGQRSPLTLPDRHAAALSGSDDTPRDAWAAGYTPSLAAAVWFGSIDRGPASAGSDGPFMAAPAWRQFMVSALDKMQKGDEWYQPPPGLESSVVDGRQAYFLPGTSASTPAPPLPDSVHVAAA